MAEDGMVVVSPSSNSDDHVLQQVTSGFQEKVAATIENLVFQEGNGDAIPAQAGMAGGDGSGEPAGLYLLVKFCHHVLLSQPTGTRTPVSQPQGQSPLRLRPTTL